MLVRNKSCNNDFFAVSTVYYIWAKKPILGHFVFSAGRPLNGYDNPNECYFLMSVDILHQKLSSAMPYMKKSLLQPITILINFLIYLCDNCAGLAYLIVF